MLGILPENVHRTAFRTAWANDAVGWFAGLCSGYSSTFYRHYHGWHHRFTQIPGKDPELEDPKPTSLGAYIVEMSGIPWWIGKIKTYAIISAGRTERYPYIPVKARGEVVRSVRLQMLCYAALIAVSIILRQPLFLVFWLVPVAVAQPLLRGLTMAEHTGCTYDDDPLTNTRTTRTLYPIRFLMWNMPYHAEHHRYPALPFHALGAAHKRMRPALAHVASGYFAAHWSIIRGFRRARSTSASLPS
jgi:fatty acid desaturase